MLDSFACAQARESQLAAEVDRLEIAQAVLQTEKQGLQQQVVELQSEITDLKVTALPGLKTWLTLLKHSAVTAFVLVLVLPALQVPAAHCENFVGFLCCRSRTRTR